MPLIFVDNRPAVEEPENVPDYSHPQPSLTVQRGQLDQLTVPTVDRRSAGRPPVAAHTVDDRGRRRRRRRIGAADAARYRYAIGADQQIQTVVQTGRLTKAALQRVCRRVRQYRFV